MFTVLVDDDLGIDCSAVLVSTSGSCVLNSSRPSWFLKSASFVVVTSQNAFQSVSFVQNFCCGVLFLVEIPGAMKILSENDH